MGGYKSSSQGTREYLIAYGKGLDYWIMVGSRKCDLVDLTHASLQRVFRECSHHRNERLGSCSFCTFSVGWTRLPSAQKLAAHGSPEGCTPRMNPHTERLLPCDRHQVPGMQVTTSRRSSRSTSRSGCPSRKQRLRRRGGFVVLFAQVGLSATASQPLFPVFLLRVVSVAASPDLLFFSHRLLSYQLPSLSFQPAWYCVSRPIHSSKRALFDPGRTHFVAEGDQSV
jgi:hypothetical protein